MLGSRWWVLVKYIFQPSLSLEAFLDNYRASDAKVFFFYIKKHLFIRGVLKKRHLFNILYNTHYFIE